LEQAFFDSKPKVYPYKQPEKITQALLDEIDTLKEALFDTRTPGDTVGLKKLLDRITQSVRKAGTALPPKTIRGLYLDVLYHIIELLRTEKIPLDRVWMDERTPAEAISSAVNLTAIQACLRKLLRHSGQYRREREADRHGHAVEMIKKYVADHVYGKISLAGVAQYVALSPNYVCRLFKRETGETVIAYAQRIKVETAKALLLQDRRVVDVAAKLCFTSESYFIKVFKKYTGMTSSEFLRGYSSGRNGSR
jgi:two-component system response regulator YesN